MHDLSEPSRPAPLTLPHLYTVAIDTSIHAGFPSPAEDHAGKRIDVLENLVRHPQATYQMRVKGDSMRDEGIFDGDIVLIDRAINPRNGHIVVAEIDGEFLVKKLVLRQGRMKLKAGNPTFADIIPKDGQTITIWGVVLTAFKKFQI
jgi:DNA polymerase V